MFQNWRKVESENIALQKKGKCKESFARLGLEYVKIPQKDLQIKNPSNAKKDTTQGVKCLHLREVPPQKIGKEVLEK